MTYIYVSQIGKAMSERNKYCYDESIIDANVLRKEAVAQSKDERFGKAAMVIIHFHRADGSCEGKQHEYYQDGKELIE